MDVVNLGSKVTISYEGTIASGEVFESTKDTEELVFTVGVGSVMLAFEEGVIGMKIGENKEININGDEIFGAYRQELVQTVKKDLFKPGTDFKVGNVLYLTITKDDEDHQVPVSIVEVQDDAIIVDYNHPLAGQPLTYTITIDKIEKSDQKMPFVPDPDHDQ